MGGGGAKDYVHARTSRAGSPKSIMAGVQGPLKDPESSWVFSSPEPKAQVSYCRPFSSVVRRPSSVNFLHFHLLLENAWLDFNQTWQESFLEVGDSKVVQIVCVAPMGAQGEGPKGPKPCKFQTSSSPDPEGE